MKALIQRVTQAWVTVDDEIVGSIGPGLLVFLGVGEGDDLLDATYLVDKVTNLRIFADSDDRVNLSAFDVQAELLVISQFTLYANTRRGRRPSFTEAAQPDEAGALFQRAVAVFETTGLKIETGSFQKHMLVHLVNDGPFTIMLDSLERTSPRKK